MSVKGMDSVRFRWRGDGCRSERFRWCIRRWRW